MHRVDVIAINLILTHLFWFRKFNIKRNQLVLQDKALTNHIHFDINIKDNFRWDDILVVQHLNIVNETFYEVYFRSLFRRRFCDAILSFFEFSTNLTNILLIFFFFDSE